MKVKCVLSALVSAAVVLTSISIPGNVANAAPSSLVPSKSTAETGNYVCTWNIQDWVAWHENQVGSSDKRDVVDPEHLFNEKTGWVSTMYPEVRGDLYFLLDDGWDLPYGTKKGGKNKQYFGCQVLPDDKFPVKEYGKTPQQKLKVLNEKIKSYGWKGTGLWICAQTSNAYPEYAGKNEEEFWRMRLQWSKYAGIAYWKIDWGTEQKKIEWRRKISEWAEEEYPELIIEHVVGGSGQNKSNGRIESGLLEDNVEFAAFSDVFRTYDVLDNLATALTLDRVGEQLISGFTEKGDAMGLINAEDEMYICASLGLSAGVMRFTPYVTTDTAKSGSKYFGMGTEKNTYFAGGKKFVDTKATRNRFDEVARTVRWQRIAPPYEVGAYDTKLSNAYLTDDWTFTSQEPAWDKTTGKVSMKAPAAIARGIDLPKVSVKSGDDIPYVTASRNPNGAISIATYSRTHSNTGYQPVKSANVTLNAGDLTGKIGVFGYYNSLKLTFNQKLSGKKVYAQDLLSNKAQDITSKVQINGNTITIPGSVITQIGLSAATKGDTSDPGMVLQIGEASDFVSAPKTNQRLERHDVNNGSFERFHYDANNGQTIKSVTAADWSRWKNTDASYINEEGHTGKYSGIHKANKNYEVSTYQLNEGMANGLYKASCYVKASKHSRTAPGNGHSTSAGFYVMNYGGSAQYVDIQKMGALKDWTYIEIPEINVTNGQLQLEFYSYGASGEYLIFDDVKVEYVGKQAAQAKIQPILKFDFSDYKQGNNGNATLVGVAGNKEVTADAKGVTFKTDGDGNDVVVFPDDGGKLSTGITFTPGDSDPMKQLKAGRGATVAMWIKSDKNNFSSQLFSYGALQGNGELGASAQILARNNVNGDIVFYRNQSGSTEGQKLSATTNNPYKKNTWHLVAYVESGNGTGTMYVDGEKIGTSSVTGKTLCGFATDGNKKDSYYIGFLPYAVSGDSHFTGSMDSVVVYDAALSGAQLKELYNERFETKYQIVLDAAEDGILGGQAGRREGYVGWMGYDTDAQGAEGTVTFKFDAKPEAAWNMDIYYLSKPSSEKPAGSHDRDFVITVNKDTKKAVTVTCPEGKSWDDVSLASKVTLKGIRLKQGGNVIKLGNPKENAPSLVRIVLTNADYAAAKEVEAQIMGQLGTVDDVAQLGMVQEIRANYDALSPEAKKLVSKEAYNMLLSAEDFMKPFLENTDTKTYSYEIEKGKLTGEAKVSSSADTSGGKYVSYIGGSGNGMSEIVVANSGSGQRTLRVYYAGKENRQMNVIVNGKKYQVTCESTGSWTAIGKPVELKADFKNGANTIQFAGVNGAYAPNLDRVEIDLPVVDKQKYKMEAEDAKLSGKITVVNNGDASGDKYLGHIGGDGKGVVTFNVFCNEAGTRKIRLYYAANEQRSFSVEANGTVRTATCTSTGSWHTVGEYVGIQVDLVPGNNKIMVTGVDGAYAPNLDCAEIELSLHEVAAQ